MSIRSRNVPVPDISEEDVIEAMKDIQGYMDITPADFREIYRTAYRHAVSRLLKTLKAAEIMTQNVHVLYADTPLNEAAALLADKGITGTPVTDGSNHVIGVISEKDFLRRMGAGKSDSFMQITARLITNGGCLTDNIKAKTVGEIMSSPAVTITEDVSVGTLSALMSSRNINRLPVVDADGGLKGIVTRSDIINSFGVFGGFDD